MNGLIEKKFSALMTNDGYLVSRYFGPSTLSVVSEVNKATQ